MNVLPSWCYPPTADAAMKRWNVICEVINVAGQKEIKDHITLTAANEDEARAKAKSHFKSRGAVAVKVYSVMDLG